MSLIREPCRSIAAPVLGIDPYAIEVLDNPYRLHARLRDAGPVALIAQHQVYAVGCFAETSAVLSDPPFIAAVGIGIQDIRKPGETGLHVGFGMGVHICLGQMIGRLEAESILKAIVSAADRLEPAGVSRYRPVNQMRQLDHCRCEPSANDDRRNLGATRSLYRPFHGSGAPLSCPVSRRAARNARSPSA